MHLDVVVIGNVGIDTNVYLLGSGLDLSVESNFTENIDCIGQAGGYASFSYKQLGKRTGFIGYVGNDLNGNFIRQSFSKSSIDTTALFIDPAGTNRSINLMFKDGSRKNFYDGKSHMNLQPDIELCRKVLAKSQLVHFNIPNWARLLLPIARDLNLKIACDIQDVISADDPYRQDFIKYADFLFFSCVNHENPKLLVDSFIKSNKNLTVICGMGALGCAVGIEDRLIFFPPPNLELPVVDTNGAGDTLAAVFLSSHLLDGYPLHESILRAQIAARYTCAQRASSSNLITAETLDKLAMSL
ncbi:MAG: carbohydrate kinase family protein [Blastocatellia bacterium]|nr:carbohydrate kinase family protein [Blastocatellia bacterium]